MTVILDPAEKRDWIVAPVALSRAQKEAYAGRFGDRTVRLDHGTLISQRDDGPPRRISSAGEDIFDMTETGDQIMFRREGARIVGLDFISASGRATSASRSD
jgi:hypothetical protein